MGHRVCRVLAHTQEAIYKYSPALTAEIKYNIYAVPMQHEDRALYCRHYWLRAKPIYRLGHLPATVFPLTHHCDFTTIITTEDYRLVAPHYIAARPHHASVNINKNLPEHTLSPHQPCEMTRFRCSLKRLAFLSIPSSLSSTSVFRCRSRRVRPA